MAITDRDAAEGERRMEKTRQAGYATAARYEPETASIVVTLHTGAPFSSRPASPRGLAGASDEDLSEIETGPDGLGLHRPRLAADLYIPGLLQGVFGTRRWMAAELGAAGGG